MTIYYLQAVIKIRININIKHFTHDLFVASKCEAVFLKLYVYFNPQQKHIVAAMSY